MSESALRSETIQEMIDRWVPDDNKLVAILGNHKFKVVVLEPIPDSEAYMISGNNVGKLLFGRDAD